MVVIGRNEGERLVRCLMSVRAADYPAEAIELIYVDTASTDESCANAERLGARVLRIAPSRPSAAMARNTGWRAARHELVHFFDGDTVVNPAWIGTAVRAMGDARVAGVFGRREEMAPRASVYNFWMHHDWYVAPGPAEGCAGDVLFRRSVLERAGGFDEALIAGEEWDLCHRIRTGEGMIVLRLDDPMTRHDINMTRFRQYWRRSTRTGHCHAELASRYPEVLRWRRTMHRDLGHCLAPLLAGLASLVIWSPIPLLAWMGIIGAAVTRNALRVRGRVGSLPGALLYSAHHYLGKLPITLGQVDFWLRRGLRRTPRTLIEYR